MPFLIDATDRPGNAALRIATRAAHGAYVEKVAHLVLAGGGKLTDDGTRSDGSFFIIDVETREEAEAFIAGDPFHQAGLFESVHIRLWRKSYFDRVHV